jgi:hypothetical protein
MRDALAQSRELQGADLNMREEEGNSALGRQILAQARERPLAGKTWNSKISVIPNGPGLQVNFLQ